MNFGTYVSSDLGRASEGHKRNSSILHECFSKIWPISTANCDDIIETIFLEDATNNSCQSSRRQACGQSWLPNNQITTYQSQRAIPTKNSLWEIKSSNHTHYSQWIPLLHHSMLRPFTRYNLSRYRPAHTNCHIANINDFLHFSKSFRFDLAHF